MFKKFTKISIILIGSITLLCSSIITDSTVANAHPKSNKRVTSSTTSQKLQSVFNIFYEVANILGVNEQTIIEKVKNGMTLGEIAENYNISESTLIDKLEDRAEAYINKALADGSITQTQANNMKIYLREMLKVLVENKYASSSDLLFAPEGLTATSKNKNSIYISWSFVSKATSYHIYRATSQYGTYKRIGTSKKTNYTDKKLRIGTTYYYKVKAVNSSGLSPYSLVVKATVGRNSSSLSAPSGFTAKAASDTQISLQWNSVSKATNYYIYRATSSSANYSKIASTNLTYYTDKNLSEKTTYYYKVQAVSNSSNSEYSFVVAATTQVSIIYLATPANLTAKSEDDDEISLDWDSVDHATYYYIYRATSSSGTFSKITTVTDTDYTDRDLNENTTYYYKVQAYDGSDTSEYSSIVRATTGDNSDSDLDAPDDLNIVGASENEISLEWDKVNDAECYYVYRSKSKSGTYSKIATVDDTDYTDKDLDDDTTYYYKVKAYDNGDTSDYSSVAYASTDEESDLDAPDDLEITDVKDDEISLEWDEVDDAKCYYIYRSKSASGSYSKVATVADTDYTDDDLNDDTTYYYKVKAFDGIDASDYSSIVYATTDED